MIDGSHVTAFWSFLEGVYQGLPACAYIDLVAKEGGGGLRGLPSLYLPSAR